MKSMTGFGHKEMRIGPLGKVCFEIRSTNHKSLETVLHLPVGLLSLENKIKKEIEAKIKRGRVVCTMNIAGGPANTIFINKALLKNYILVLKNIQERFRIKDGMRLDTLIHLPGVLALTENRVSPAKIWPSLKILVRKTLEGLVGMRQKEGGALYVYFKMIAHMQEANMRRIETRFRKVIKDKLTKIPNAEERASFLKNTDITEEVERSAFHIRHFRNKLSQAGPMGKELDFIAQEMQREANTIGAKSCDAVISTQVVQLKSQIEKIREQVQNIE